MGHGHGHGHGTAGAAPDRRWLGIALTLIVCFMLAELVVGLLAGSLALLTDAAHMLTDAAAIALALVASRLAQRPASGGYTYGLKRTEILSAQANGITLLLLAVWFLYEGVHRLVAPPPVEGGPVLVTALVGVLVNVAAAWCVSRANRSSLNVEGAYQHIVNDLFAFVATAVAGLIVLLTGFTRADAIAALFVAVLMVKAGWGLLRDSGRIFLEAAPRGVDPDRLGARLAAVDGIAEVHDLHIWEITSGEPALSAHVLVRPDVDCHAARLAVEGLLRADRITHTTLQVDHVAIGAAVDAVHCEQAHGPVHRTDREPEPQRSAIDT